jgi:hypothetical protein
MIQDPFAQRMPPSMSHAPRHRRRWFQFGLGTMLIAVTLLALLLGPELNMIQQRKAAISRIQQTGGLIWSLEAYEVSKGTRNWSLPADRQTPAIPRWRRWLGDEPFVLVICRVQDASIMRSLFPESQVEAPPE